MASSLSRRHLLPTLQQRQKFLREQMGTSLLTTSLRHLPRLRTARGQKLLLTLPPAALPPLTKAVRRAPWQTPLERAPLKRSLPKKTTRRMAAKTKEARRRVARTTRTRTTRRTRIKRKRGRRRSLRSTTAWTTDSWQLAVISTIRGRATSERTICGGCCMCWTETFLTGSSGRLLQCWLRSLGVHATARSPSATSTRRRFLHPQPPLLLPARLTRPAVTKTAPQQLLASEAEHQTLTGQSGATYNDESSQTGAANTAN
mmetsp:Transcript_19587/g.59258  ORF Transcript_19587/g.59258 Transcript_19587/m.59258 type:complete len:259 (+) Transcript_19587:914-1690(+)